MPDKEIMLQIRQLEEQRAWSVLDELRRGEGAANAVAEDLRDALASLAESWRAGADLYGRAKLKGSRTVHEVPLLHAAQQLDLVIKGLEQPRRAPLGQLQSPTPVHADAGLDEPRHRFVPIQGGSTCTALVMRGDGAEDCGRFASHPAHRLDGPTERPGLDALIAEASGAVRTIDLSGAVSNADASDPSAAERVAALRTVTVDMSGPAEGSALGVTPEQVADTAKMAADAFPGQVGADEVTAYLRGVTEDIAGSPPLQPSGVHDQTDPADDLGVFGIDERTPETLPTVRETLEHATVTMPPVPLLGQPGDAGAGYAHSYVPPEGVPMTFAELMTPVPAAHLPAHLSHSQIETALDCPTKYRAQRLQRQMLVGISRIDQIPQWALIGGKTFHAVIEAFERTIIDDAPRPPLSIYRDVARDVAGSVTAGPWEMDCEKTWRAAFDAECQKIEATSPVPRSRWRASKQGAEGETWWNVNGPLMITRYLAARPAEMTATMPALDDPHGALSDAIELELTMDVPTPYGPLPYRAILDRVTWDVRRTAYVIRDYKTGASMPEDTSQLGEYANVLRLFGVPAGIKIFGTYFNARKGTWTPEVDLDQAWPLEWFVHHVASGHAARLALTTGPTPARPSSYCGGCSVRWACPVKNAGRTS